MIYPRLAAVNLKKNSRIYFPYILTCVLSAAMFFTIMSICYNQGLNEIPASGVLKSMMWMGCWIIGFFSMIFLFYTNSFLIKRRTRELGLYSILGMEKKHVALVLIFETLYVISLTLVFGILFGILLEKLMFLLLARLLNFSVPIIFSVPLKAVAATAVLFSVIFFFILLANLRHIRVSNPIDLLHSGKKGEREPKASWMIAIVGLLSLGGGYYISLTVGAPSEALGYFFEAVILVIIGTYALFTSGSVAVLKILKRNKRFYYQKNHFISVSSMIYRMKQNAVGLANICILSTTVLVIVSATVSMYAGQSVMLRQECPQDIGLSFQYEGNKIREVRGILESEAEDAGVRLTDIYEYPMMSGYGYLRENRLEGNYRRGVSSLLIRLVTLEDYNRMEHTSETLEEGEILFYRRGKGLTGDFLSIGGKEYKIKKELPEFLYEQKTGKAMSDGIYIVFRDMDSLVNAGTAMELTDGPVEYMFSANLEGDENQKILFTENIERRLSLDDSISSKNYYTVQKEWYVLYGSFLFVGIFLGLLFLIATVLIIYYKQITEGYDDHERFEIMQKVGMSQREVKSTIHKQILTVFFLPLIGAVFHLAAAAPVLMQLLRRMWLDDAQVFLGCGGLTVLIFILLYMTVYSLTAKTYYQLVQYRE